MKNTTAFTLAALIGATASANAQVSTFGYVGEVIEIQDGLNLFGSAAVGSEGTGAFTLDLDAEQWDNPQGGGDFIGFFEALDLNVAIEEFAASGTSTEHLLFALAQNNLGTLDSPVDTLEIQLSFSETAAYDFGYVAVNLIGTEDWFESTGTLPDPLSMGFENLLSAEVVIEFYQLQGDTGGDGSPGDGGGGGDVVMVTSRAVINIGSMANAQGTVATIGCRSFQFADPVAQFDFFDISEFITEFTAEAPAADMNSDGMFNFFDVATFVSQVQTNCSN